MTVADNLRKICAAARPAIEAALDAAEELSEVREAASEQGLDWSAVKALLKAQIQDERDGGERVTKLVSKADTACSYATMMASNNVAEKRKTPPQSESAAVPLSRRGDGEATEAPNNDSVASSPDSTNIPDLDIRAQAFHPKFVKQRA